MIYILGFAECKVQFKQPRDCECSSAHSISDRLLFHQQEFPFFTLTSFPSGFLLHVGGVVSARSVKLLDRIHNPGEFSSHKQTLT